MGSLPEDARVEPEGNLDHVVKEVIVECMYSSHSLDPPCSCSS